MEWTVWKFTSLTDKLNGKITDLPHHIIPHSENENINIIKTQYHDKYILSQTRDQLSRTSNEFSRLKIQCHFCSAHTHTSKNGHN